MNLRNDISKRLLGVCYGLSLFFSVVIALVSNQWIITSAATCTIAALLVSAFVYQRHMRIQEERIVLNKDEQFIRAYRQKRHDWMNDLQLIFSYVQLKKLDKLSMCVENIKTKLKEEGKLLSLKLPSLQQFLLTYNYMYPDTTMLVNIKQGVLLERAGDALRAYQSFIIEVLQLCQRLKSEEERNHGHALNIQLLIESNEQGFTVDIVCRGGFDHETFILQVNKLVHKMHVLQRIQMTKVDEDNVTIRINIPNQTQSG